MCLGSSGVKTHVKQRLRRRISRSVSKVKHCPHPSGPHHIIAVAGRRVHRHRLWPLRGTSDGHVLVYDKYNLGALRALPWGLIARR